jgi:hypothetical protein
MPAAETPGRVLLMDASVLLVLFVGLWDRALVGRHRKTREYDPEDFDAIKDIAMRFDSLATTPHVLAEVCNHADWHDEPGRTALFESIQRRISNFDELYEPSSGLAVGPAFVRLGLTDSAIASAAQRSALVVLTTDLDLWVHLMEIEVPAYNYNHFKGARILPYGLK